MIRGLLSIVSLIIIVGSLIVIIPILILPNTFLHQIIPVLAPLHQALACTEGETIRYEAINTIDGYDTHYRCVDARGNERDVDSVLLRPAYISLGTLCLGGLLMFVPFMLTVRRGRRGEFGAETQAILHGRYPAATQPVPVRDPVAQEKYVTEKLKSLAALRQQGLINEADYEAARRKILEQPDG